MKKILLLTAVESPYRGRLVETQLLKPLAKALDDPSQMRADYLAILPALSFFTRRRFFKGLSLVVAARSRLRGWLRKCGISVLEIPTLYPLVTGRFNMKASEAMAFLCLSLPLFLLALIRMGPGLIIARSYPAAMLALWARKFLGTPYIFDMRGLYPLESVNAGVFALGSSDYFFWVRRERESIRQAVACVVVSRPFSDEVSRIAPDAKTYIIPCGVDDEEIRYDWVSKSEAKKRYGLEGRFVLLHLGSFGTRGDRGLVAKYLKRFRQLRPDAVLVVATGTLAFVSEIEAAFVREGLTRQDFMILNPDPERLDEVRALGDAGLILERKAANTHVCLSVKLGEYLASGIPVICTPFVEGAAGLVREYNCGLIVDPDDESQPLELERGFLVQYPILRKNGFRLVREYLSLNQCAKRWRGMIEEVLSTL